MLRIMRLFLVLLSVGALLGSTVRAAADSPIADAARRGDLAEVRALIASNEDVNATSGDGSTALLWAAYNFDIEMARALLAAGATLDSPNNYGVTPLLQASRTGDQAMIEFLLDAGADPGLGHTEGETPLMAASRSGSLPAVRLLIEGGADVNAADTFQDQTALMWAAAEGHVEVVDALLRAGADPDHQAHVTSISDRKNADHPTGGFTALMWAARNGEEATARRLVEGGADLNLKNGDGASAAMIAIYNDRFDLAATLIGLGSDVNDGSLYTAVEMRRSTTDQFAFDGSRLRPNHENTRTALDIIELLLDRGADPHQRFQGQFHSTSMPNSDRFDSTPFLRAAVGADVEALEVFVSYVSDLDAVIPVVVPDVDPDADPDAEGDAPPAGRGRGNPDAGRTASMLAINGGRPPAMTGGPGYIRDGEAPYREPGSRKPEDAFALLLEAGADPNAKAPDGSTLLHQVTRAGNLDMIRALAQAGVDFEVTDGDGLTALDIAEGKRREGAENGRGRGRGGRGRGGRGGGPSEEVATLLRDLMGLPPAPPRPAAPPAEELQPGDSQ
jgi:ankyrin repeat protein